MGGSAQNTLHTCIGLSNKYETILVHGLSKESRMTELERAEVGRLIQVAERKGVRFFPLASLIRAIEPLNDLISLWSLFRIIRKEKPDLVHTHSSKAGLLGRLAAWLNRVPVVVHTAHGHVFYGHFGRVLSRAFIVVERLAARITDRMIALTEGERNDYLRYGVSKPEKTVTIHSGVNVDRFSRRDAVSSDKPALTNGLGLDPDRLVVGTVGWLLPIKGPMILLKAMLRVWKVRPDIQLVFVGKGDLEDLLKREAEYRRVDGQVHFLGWRDDIEAVLPVFDLFVLPSLNEGMGRVLVEAMAAGKPIVASNTGGIPDLVVHGKNGLLVAPGDPEELAGAIQYLIDHPQRTKDMGDYGREFCKRFSLGAMLEKIDLLYQGLIFDGFVKKPNSPQRTPRAQ